MAKVNLLLIEAFRTTAKNLRNGKPYEWGHMGNCNCGNLAQTLLNIDKKTIHEFALVGVGDWSEQVNDYCPTSGLQMDKMIFGLLEKGLSTTDLKNLEYLSDPLVLANLPENTPTLKNNNREDVALYLETWAKLLENCLIENIELPQSEGVFMYL
ncbi:MAG: hypothetical protein ACEQSR_12215 [Candidatus Methylacidiphilales bacterium]